MLTKTQLQQYLDRLELDRPASLPQLHLAHLRHLPFENLDITFKRPIVLGHDPILGKLLNEQRGGFCYELNYGFYCLLRTLGFEVALIQARVFDGEGKPGPDFDHMQLKVEHAGQSWLADVGFGDSFQEPLVLIEGEQREMGGRFLLSRQQEHWLMQRDGKAALLIDPRPRDLAEFTQMAAWHQGPSSHFTRKAICSMATASGRISLSDNQLLVTHQGERSVLAVRDEGHYRQLLAEHFQVQLPFADVAGWLAKWQ